MPAPNRAAEVAAWVGTHRSLFVGDADETTRLLLTPLAQYLNIVEGRNVWGLLVKTERNPPFIPHDILMWKDTREHFDVFTGPDSGRAEDVQAIWGYNAAPDDPRWIWQDVGGTVEPVPVPDPVPAPTSTPAGGRVDVIDQQIAELATRVAQLEARRQADGAATVRLIAELQARCEALEQKPAPTFELPALVAEGSTGRTFGHGHSVRLTVHRA